MKSDFWHVAQVISAAMAIAAGSAHAQDPKPVTQAPKPSVQNMTILNGGIETNHYFVHGGSPHLKARYRELELAENEVTLAEELSRLKLDYVQNERVLDSLRVSQLQYGSPGGYYGPDCYSGGGFGGYPTGDLLIKSQLAPQLGQAARYENGVRAIRTWEAAQVEAEKTLKKEISPAPQAAPKVAPGPRQSRTASPPPPTVVGRAGAATISANETLQRNSLAAQEQWKAAIDHWQAIRAIRPWTSPSITRVAYGTGTVVMYRPLSLASPPSAAAQVAIPPISPSRVVLIRSAAPPGTSPRKDEKPRIDTTNKVSWLASGALFLCLCLGAPLLRGKVGLLFSKGNCLKTLLTHGVQV